MASAAARTSFSVTRSRKQYQLFQPIDGVSMSLSPTTILKGRSAIPRAFLARSVTTCSPRSGKDPVRMPVRGSSASPRGRLSAAKLHRAIPRCRDGEEHRMAGCRPNTLGPLIRGLGEGLGVRITGSSRGP